MKRRSVNALVVEGGGMRGVFAAGVLDCFLEKQFDPFDAYFGASAGACNLSSHLGKQHGRNYRCYTDYMLKPEFFSLKKYVRGGHYMDLDWFLFRKYPSLRKALRERESRYNSAVDFIQNPPGDADVMEICPSLLHSGRTTRDRKRLELDFAEGKRKGLSAIERWREKG